MKVLLINGSPRENGCTYTALSEVEKTLQKNGIETEMLYLGKGPVEDCRACGACGKLRRCAVDDLVNKVIEDLDNIDGIVVGTPVYYAGPSGRIKSFLDRLFYAGGGKMKRKLGSAVVSCRRGGAASAFDEVNKYFTKSNMPVISSHYWNQVHGNTPEEVLQDAEGMQSMRYIGENMAWLLKCIKAGEEAGVPLPAYEKNIFTNFIR